MSVTATDLQQRVFIETERMHAMYRAFIETGGEPLDYEALSKGMVLAALLIREKFQGELTLDDAAWIRSFAEAIETAHEHDRRGVN